MDAYEAILTKRDTREYDGRAIEEEHLDRILRAARMAGSSKNAQPIRLIVIRDEAQKQRLAACGDFTEHLPTSPLVIVIARHEESRAFDAGRTAQNMMVTAHALGIASCPVGIQHDNPAREVLELPSDMIVAMAITFGYPPGGRAISRGEPRMSMDEYVSWERFGA